MGWVTRQGDYPGTLGGGGGVGHQVTPHTNRLLSTLSESITYTNNHPAVCPCVFVCVCLCLCVCGRTHPHLLGSDSSQGVYCSVCYCIPLKVTHSPLSQVSPPGFLPTRVRALTQFPSKLRGVFGVTIGRPCSASRAGVIWRGRQKKLWIKTQRGGTSSDAGRTNIPLNFNCAEWSLMGWWFLHPGCCSELTISMNDVQHTVWATHWGVDTRPRGWTGVRRNLSVFHQRLWQWFYTM